MGTHAHGCDFLLLLRRLAGLQCFNGGVGLLKREGQAKTGFAPSKRRKALDCVERGASPDSMWSSDKFRCSSSKGRAARVKCKEGDAVGVLEIQVRTW